MYLAAPITASIVAEKAGFDAETDADGGVKLLVGEETLAITVVILEKQVLVVAVEYAVIQFDDGIIVEPPAFAFDQRDSRTKPLIARGKRGANLIDAAVIEDILILHAVDYGYPELAVHRNLRVNHDTAAERHAVPRTGGYAVTAV